MHVLGLMGSPRKKGNTAFLLQAMMDAAEQYGAQTDTLEPARMNLLPCRGCGHCEKKGVCIISNDDMAGSVYRLMRRADVVVVATPIYFYNAPAQLKSLIDRSQSLWSRIYRKQLRDPKSAHRKGFLLSLGATKGANLFEGVELTARYFFDAIAASYDGSLTYRRIEDPGDMEAHETVIDDVARAAKGLFAPLEARRRVLFACRENACRSQMAAAYASLMAGDKIDTASAGSTPAEFINPLMEEVMMEEGIDMKYRRTGHLDQVIESFRPEIIVTMGCAEECPFVQGVKRLDWDLPDPANGPVDLMRQVRDDIKSKVQNLITEL